MKIGKKIPLDASITHPFKVGHFLKVAPENNYFRSYVNRSDFSSNSKLLYA
ncbi:MAG: hypothetical protein Q4B84_03550 [Clostridia bacterium]|nr:hypothetical protein [Clostridia bacterium]